MTVEAHTGTEDQALQEVQTIRKCCPDLVIEAYNSSTHRQNWKMRMITPYAVIEHLRPGEVTWHTLHLTDAGLKDAYKKGFEAGRREGHREVVANILPGGLNRLHELVNTVEVDLKKQKPEA